jgi:peptide/nickel transport system substrate-binding protein
MGAGGASARRTVLVAMALLLAGAALPDMGGSARAQSRAETLRQVTGNNINTLDPTTPGATRESFGVSVSTYDRLVAFDRKRDGDVWVFDPGKIRGELAERYEISPDGLKITFHLRKDAKFHDGTPVTAEDVKWSLDRAMSAKSLAAGQLGTGSLTRPEQFTVVDPLTLTVDLPKADRLALANLATPLAPIFNSKLARQHATPEDPWAQEWLKTNTAGSGAYVVETFKPGEQIILRRNETWAGRGGELPFFKRVIEQTVPDVATRSNLIEKGDADIATDLQASDVPALQARGKLRIDSTPQSNGFTMIAFNTQMAPFDKAAVRQAIAAALPYDDMFSAAIFKRGLPLFGAKWTAPPDGRFPQPMPVSTDLAKAKQLLAEAGLAGGFKTTFTINVGSASVTEPMAILIRESLARIGVEVEIQKLPDAQMSTAINDKKLPFFTEASSAWLPTTDYFFRNFFTGNHRWNYSSWNDPLIAELGTKARFERDQGKYDEMSKQMIAEYVRELPLILLWQANQDAVMVPTLDGYTYWYHRQVDFRDLRRK